MLPFIVQKWINMLQCRQRSMGKQCLLSLCIGSWSSLHFIGGATFLHWTMDRGGQPHPFLSHFILSHVRPRTMRDRNFCSVDIGSAALCHWCFNVPLCTCCQEHELQLPWGPVDQPFWVSAHRGQSSSEDLPSILGVSHPCFFRFRWDTQQWHFLEGFACRW